MFLLVNPNKLTLNAGEFPSFSFEAASCVFLRLEVKLNIYWLSLDILFGMRE